MRIPTLLTIVAVCGLLAGLSACDEPAYEGGVPDPQAAAPPQDDASPRSGPAFGSGGGSALGGARRAADRTVDRVDDQQRRLLDEMDD